MIDDTWQKSSYSGNVRQSCVEVRLAQGISVNLRDTQHRHLGHLTLPTTEWQAFLYAVRQDELG
ncbi:DUF397 domain-containing protein [Spiractinospora alimapuensis]|uniref:DUF397 domain-containing protein n=1 Tax=Spiractinospora alimapuensis TaxID=2820884 RepID=UPI001F1E10BB|nr:DUF397 domain-containing protein [Spiractinospora alimapuensis]QVQ54124.1 DUF397 domain-containing protein [Spiractinospora alimapuensis]